MKSLLLVLPFLYTISAQACPQIVGKYDCKRFIAGYEFANQSMNGVWEFTVNGESYLADGTTHDLTRPGVTGTYMSACEKEESYVFHQSFVEDDNPTQQIETTIYSFKGGDLKTMFVDQEFIFGSLVLKIDDICQLNEE